jgi:hypothetical protein
MGMADKAMLKLKTEKPSESRFAGLFYFERGALGGKQLLLTWFQE